MTTFRQLPTRPIKARDPIVRELFTIAHNRQLKLDALASDVGIDQTQLSNYRADRVMPGIGRVQAIAAALGYRLVLEPAEAMPRIRSTEGMAR